ncbi:hypothetical protein ABB37_07768 [Leptomonas pyrrhocoris]|uniref:Uncharacterized protein n=1 Tax=Leptomonas pyrrhocoris TaxID=157538 RepID=A0A0M9FUN5_LEPPY|nr:hypothetical protein ABB37_07768 [Leptomonas pyrrhocoris]KPA76445.1 hypothetical protein ABB37_07768 [Leptomonas pyrrhocoris]|eukprot:XP_015654884.1 hypothetical protein ABB37_07768 [Leptomonas pyrrhocoris]
MARRDRVPRHKSHNHKRNQNAKLSPFQREQKRAKLANQVPTARTIGGLDSIPHSQRHVFNFLQEKMQRQKAKRAALELERHPEKAAAVDVEASVTGNSSRHAADPSAGRQQKTAVSQKANEPATAVSAERGTPATTSPTAKSAKKKKAKILYPSLNDELTASVGAALLPISRRSKDSASTSAEATAASASAAEDSSTPRSVEEIIARKKERKHLRKQEARRARVAAKLEDMEAELDTYVKGANSVSKKGRAKRGEDSGTSAVRDRVNLAFERQLRAMEKEKVKKETARQLELVAEAKMKKTTKKAEDGLNSRKRHRDDHGGERESTDEESHEDGDGHRSGTARAVDSNSAEELPLRQRKRISFDPEVADPTTAAQSARRATTKTNNHKPQDFYELVDVVRYGERVEAPPVFDVVPNRLAAVSRLANQLEREAGGGRGDARHRLLAGGGQLGEQKRLARLGLAPAITHTVRADASTEGTRMSKEDEIKALRDRVMATYQRNRRTEVAVRKGVDMRHEFPRFS